MPHYISNLAGLSFCPKESKTVVLNLQPGDQLDLEREPMNAYDENAIKVYALVKGGTTEPADADEIENNPDSVERHFIGYIEKLANPLIARDLDAGLTFTCQVEKTYPDDGTSARQGMWAKPLIAINTFQRA